MLNSSRTKALAIWVWGKLNLLWPHSTTFGVGAAADALLNSRYANSEVPSVEHLPALSPLPCGTAQVCPRHSRSLA